MSTQAPGGGRRVAARRRRRAALPPSAVAALVLVLLAAGAVALTRAPDPDPVVDPTLALEPGRRIFIPSLRVLTDVILGEAGRKERA